VVEENMVFINLLTALEGITAVGRHSMSSELPLPGGEAAVDVRGDIRSCLT
jgi:hypothetical protein